MVNKKNLFIVTGVATLGAVAVMPEPSLTELVANAETIEFYASNTSSDSASVETSFVTANNSDGTLTITGYSGAQKDLVIPATIDGKSVKRIDDNAFARKGLTTVVIGNGIKEIGAYAFQGNSLTAITIPASVTSIGDYAFHDNQLSNVTVPSSVTQLGVSAFQKNSITSYTLPATITIIPDYLFDDNQLKYASIPATVTSVGIGSFSGNDIETLDIKNGVKLIGDSAFKNNKLTSLYLPESVLSVGSGAFSGNNVKSVTIPETLSSVVSQVADKASDLDSLNLYAKGKDPGYDSGVSASLKGNLEDEIIIKLGLEAGDLTLVKPELATTSFGNIQLDNDTIEENIQFTSDLYISDTRGTDEGWTLTVEASPFKEVPKSGGTAPSGGWYQLPEGTISLAGLDSIYKVDNNGNRVNAGSTISYSKDENIIIDSGAVEIASAKSGDSFGIWAIKFKSDGLKINIEPDNKMVDNINYEGKPTPYSTTITWTLVNGPGK